MTNSNIGIDEPTTIDKRVDTEQLDIGGTVVQRERMQITGVSSGDIAPVSSASGLSVNLIDSTATVTIQGNSTVVFSTASTAAVIVTNSTSQKIPVIIEGSTGTVAISGNSTAVISTASAIRIDSTGTLTVTGTSNVSGSTVSVSTGLVRATWNSSQLSAGTTAVAPSFANISFATTGGQTIVSSVANATIRVLGWNVVCASTTVLTWFSDSTAGSTLAGPYHFAANGGISVPVSPLGWFQTTAAGVGLVLKSEAGSSVGGSITYIQSSAIA